MTHPTLPEALARRIADQARAQHAEVVGWRRHLHRHAELSFKEFDTADFLEAELRRIDGLQLERPTSTSLVALYVGAIALGIGNGAIDVAMNAIGVQVEKKRVRPIMSFFHGTWSIGNMLGALLLVLIAPAFAHRADPTVATVAVVVAVCRTAA